MEGAALYGDESFAMAGQVLSSRRGSDVASEGEDEPGGEGQDDGMGISFLMPGSHWTENPVAMEMMKGMSFMYAVPALQPRLTRFHGTCTPVRIAYFLKSTEVGRLTQIDHFWKRIVHHPMVWQGIYCRDYHQYRGCGGNRCVWRALEGKAGSDKCLYHLHGTNRVAYDQICKNITAIPGRLPEELLEKYRTWRSEQKALLALLETYPLQKSPTNKFSSEDAGNSAGADFALSDTAEKAADAAIEKPWSVKAHATYGLKTSHRARRFDRSQKLAPVLSSAGRAPVLSSAGHQLVASRK